ncbi:aldolase/citrate lyase family protein [Sphingomonas sp.]|uniref:aldolase/citrate lyase family protein n=1 Tax=Sphingomonas sp. TaxID=28214 RepID=UPI003B3B78F7
MTAPSLLLWLISGDAPLARMAPAAGIDRILVDLERLGKADRQRGRHLFLSEQKWSDVAALRKTAPAGTLFVRLDPLHAGSRDQIEQALALGADGLMLPYFHDATTALRFADLIAGRAIFTPLVETWGAVQTLPELLAQGVVAEFHVGLNDLALDMQLSSLQQLWGHPVLDRIAQMAAAHGTSFGVGGVTDPRMRGLPIDPVFVIDEHRRLGSTRALLGRSFKSEFGEDPDPADVRATADAIRDAYHCAALTKSPDDAERELRRVRLAPQPAP